MTSAWPQTADMAFSTASAPVVGGRDGVAGNARLEEPGYWGTRSILEINGIRLKPMPVDAEGMRFPTTAAGKPLNFATRHGTWVVEDDCDSEFRFAGHPVASLQGLRPGAPVIYVGTFSKTLYPGLRIAYMLQQAALAEFMDSGLYAAHIRRMRRIYAARRSYLIGLVEQSLGPGRVHEHDSNAGLHLVLSLPPGPIWMPSPGAWPWRPSSPCHGAPGRPAPRCGCHPSWPWGW